MNADPIIVTHDGKDWLVENGKLVPFRVVEIEMPRTVEGIQAKMAESTAAFRKEIIRLVALNDPFFPN